MNLKKLCLFCCANCVLRHELSMRIMEKLVLVNDLKGKGKLEVGLPDGLLLVPVVEIPCRPVVGPALMLDNVLTLLHEENVGTIGIYGMGGVGKTTLLKCINNRFLSLGHDLDVVIWAIVSKDFVIEKIQQAIGVRLGLSWDETQFQDLRALRIYNVIRRKKIGIPIPSKENRSKVIFTTRSLEACSYVDADYKFKVDFLNEKESWKLFHGN